MNYEIANTTVLLWDMFYLGNPHRHMYKDIKHLPHIYAQVNWIYKSHETQYDISVRRLNCTVINWKDVVIFTVINKNTYKI